MGTDFAACRAIRRRLPKKRYGNTIQGRVGGHKIYLRTGEYEDGSLGEIWIDMYKEGAAFRCVMHCFAKLFSMALQYGIPLEELVASFKDETFAPNGPVEDHETITKAASIVDYVVRAIEADYGINHDQEKD